MPQSVHIIRGLVGSGKSHAALRLEKELTSKGEQVVVVSSDHFFEKDGEYKFNIKQLGQSHADCMNRYLDAIYRGFSVIVDNTHSRFWEYKNFIEVAKIAGISLKEGIEVVVHEIRTPGIEAVRVFAKRNTHDVPASVVLNMWYRWEPVPKGIEVVYVDPDLGD